jgi:hypothetical protein
LVNQAISGTHKDRELFYKRVGLLKEETNIMVNNNSLTVIAAPFSIPPDLVDILPVEQGEMTLEKRNKI